MRELHVAVMANRRQPWPDNRNVNEHIDTLHRAVEKAAKAKALHILSSPIRESHQGKVVWEGTVEVFSVLDHATLNRAYAWAYHDAQGVTRFVTVLGEPPVTSAQAAVKAYVASLRQKTEIGSTGPG